MVQDKSYPRVTLHFPDAVLERVEKDQEATPLKMPLTLEMPLAVFRQMERQQKRRGYVRLYIGSIRPLEEATVKEKDDA